jgi:hypothetical protein
MHTGSLFGNDDEEEEIQKEGSKSLINFTYFILIVTVELPSIMLLIFVESCNNMFMAPFLLIKLMAFFE